MTGAADRIQDVGAIKTREYIRFRDATSLEFRVCCWGSVSSIMMEGSPRYMAVRNFARELAREGIPIVAGGPYRENGCGVGVQHAAHQGAFEVDPDLSIGIDLHVPEWGGGGRGRIYRREAPDTERDRESPVGFYLTAETLEDRMMFMEILSQVFIGFPVFGFGTDFERARMGQIRYFIETLKEEIPESIFVGPRGFREFGIRPRVVLIGPYDYCRNLVDHIADSDATRAWVGDDDHGIFVFRESIESAKHFILEERHRWRKAISNAGGVPEN
uniref:Uncharacterized protein n=1 Tax=Candidatus Kentrum sp. LPFa TaxID=2126335 RepID=A0A450WKG2_9GAMM|nr:MAG: hypothetical protein BECKLPF1236A_GA0070988_101726 [Candidatus Kentron sp. LPFa]VFK32425.1 MAG: hypothetical protein BECKLPF1236C_GA0070990_101665 [Candidatus Kentron sp. LPFa]